MRRSFHHWVGLLAPFVVLGSVSMALAGCQPSSPDESWGVQQLILEDDQGSVEPAGGTFSMSANGRSVAFRLADERERWAVADQGFGGLSPRVQRLVLPDDLPDRQPPPAFGSDGGVLSADGRVFVATLDRIWFDNRPGVRSNDITGRVTLEGEPPPPVEPWLGCNGDWYHHPQVVKWVRSSATGQFGSAQLVSQDVAATQGCVLPEGGAPSWWLGVRGSDDSRTPSVSADGLSPASCKGPPLRQLDGTTCEGVRVGGVILVAGGERVKRVVSAVAWRAGSGAGGEAWFLAVSVAFAVDDEFVGR